MSKRLTVSDVTKCVKMNKSVTQYKAYDKIKTSFIVNHTKLKKKQKPYNTCRYYKCYIFSDIINQKGRQILER